MRTQNLIRSLRLQWVSLTVTGTFFLLGACSSANQVVSEPAHSADEEAVAADSPDAASAEVVGDAGVGLGLGSSNPQHTSDDRSNQADAAADMGFTVDRDSESCSENLPFHPPGCACKPGEKAGCWTGPQGLRGKEGCSDGEQECVGTEFGEWSECRGEKLDCVEEEPEPEPGLECGCVPGTVITCSEDCSQFIICSLTGTKVCNPDGTWSACREWEFDTLSEASFCRNLFYGCFPDNVEGAFLGDCGRAFTCGEVPIVPPPPLEPSPVVE